MGLARLVARRKGTTIVLLGAAVSLSVVAMTASRFPWRRTKAEIPPAEPRDQDPTDARASDHVPTRPRFKPAPPRDPHAPRWDTPPAASVQVQGNPPSP
jgi:hypothetical protein